MSVETRTHYLVQVKLKAESKLQNADERWAWLAFSREGGGWPSHTSMKEMAQQFAEVPSAKVIAGYSGMPWYG